jgi:hypothetical protein
MEEKILKVSKEVWGGRKFPLFTQSCEIPQNFQSLGYQPRIVNGDQVGANKMWNYDAMVRFYGKNQQQVCGVRKIEMKNV